MSDTLETVEKKLKDKQYAFLPVQAKEAGIYRAAHWEVFHLLYDIATKKVVKNYYQCRRCDQIFNVDLSSNANTLSRHAKNSSGKCKRPEACKFIEAGLATAFAYVSQLGSEYGPIAERTLHGIIPPSFDEDNL